MFINSRKTENSLISTIKHVIFACKLEKIKFPCEQTAQYNIKTIDLLLAERSEQNTTTREVLYIIQMCMLH